MGKSSGKLRKIQELSPCQLGGSNLSTPSLGLFVQHHKILKLFTHLSKEIPTWKEWEPPIIYISTGVLVLSLEEINAKKNSYMASNAVL